MLRVSIYEFIYLFWFGSGTSDGCVHFVNSDVNNLRTLTVPHTIIGGKYNNTVEHCIAACETGNYTVAGMRFAIDCCTSPLFNEFSLHILTRLRS